MKPTLMLPMALVLLAQGATAGAAAATCPAAKFEPFFSAYAENTALQKAFTTYPLAHVLLDHATDKPREIKVAVQKNKLSFPLIPPAVTRKKQHLDSRIDAVSADKAQATIFNTETGYQKAYFFKKAKCWQLERIEDRSL